MAWIAAWALAGLSNETKPIIFMQNLKFNIFFCLSFLIDSSNQNFNKKFIDIYQNIYSGS